MSLAQPTAEADSEFPVRQKWRQKGEQAHARSSLRRAELAACPVDLLLHAILAPGSTTRSAWKLWTKTRRLDEVTWPGRRLLAPLFLRFAPGADAALRDEWPQ